MATVLNYNIKQINNYTLPSNSNISYMAIKDTNGNINEIKYCTIEGLNAFKFGYTCEPRGIIYPIFIQINGENSVNTWKEIYIGKEGMYEAQAEYIQEDSEEEHLSSFRLSAIKIPAEIEFTLDYAEVVN